MRLTRWLVGSVAALGLAFAVTAVDRAQAASLASPGAASAIKDTVGEQAIQVRWGHRGFHGFHGGFHRFHGGFHRRVFFRPRVFVRPAIYPIYYAPVYRCPLVWTVVGPRRICAYRRHYVHYWRRHHHHRFHYVHRYRHHRWM
jgi:hypothetical protein